MESLSRGRRKGSDEIAKRLISLGAAIIAGGAMEAMERGEAVSTAGAEGGSDFHRLGRMGERYPSLWGGRRMGERYPSLGAEGERYPSLWGGRRRGSDIHRLGLRRGGSDTHRSRWKSDTHRCLGRPAPAPSPPAPAPSPPAPGRGLFRPAPAPSGPALGCSKSNFNNFNNFYSFH